MIVRVADDSVTKVFHCFRAILDCLDLQGNTGLPGSGFDGVTGSSGLFGPTGWISWILGLFGSGIISGVTLTFEDLILSLSLSDTLSVSAEG